MAVVGNDGSLLAGTANGELSGAARAFRLRHDLLSKIVEAGRAGDGKSALDIGGFDFAFGMRGRGFRYGGFKPERIGIE